MLDDRNEARTTIEFPCSSTRSEGGTAGLRRPVLIVLHQEASTPGAIGQWFLANGYPLDIRRPRFGCPLPATLEQHSGVVIFGGPMSANDTDDFIRQEIGVIDVALREERPFLGVCLGAQMLARHLGASVCLHPGEVAEIGYFPITPTEAGKRICAWPSHFYQWHREGFELPDGARLLATGGNDFPNQAFSYGPAAVAVQFHSEITYALINRWLTRAAHRLTLPGALPREAHFEGHLAHSGRVRRWLDDFLSQWIEARLPVAAG